MRSALTASLLAVGVACAAGARTSAALAAAPGTPRTHRLEATAATVAYGYYWSEAAPVLRIASGDIIDVDTLLTNTPAGLEKAGVSEARIQSSLKAIVGCSGVLPENCEPGLPARIVPLERSTMRAQFAPGIVVPLHPFFGVAVTQLVDKPNVGVHVRLPRSIFVAR
jgi:acetamidase/formamidase